MNALQALALAKAYTEATIKGEGAIKGKDGKNCKIKSVEKIGNQNKVTFEWTNDDGTTRNEYILVDDGVNGADGVSITDVTSKQSEEIVTVSVTLSSGDVKRFSFTVPTSQGGGGSSVDIDDGTVSSDKTWSSRKISTEINNAKVTPEQINSSVSSYLEANPVTSDNYIYEYVNVKITAGRLLLTTGEVVSGFTKGGATVPDDFVPVTAGETIEFKTNGIWGGFENITGNPAPACWYDEDKNFVSVAMNNQNHPLAEHIVPEGVAYIGFTYWNGIDIIFRRKVAVSLSNKYKNIAIERMKHEQSVQHKYIKPYYDYSKLSSGILTFGQDDLVGDFADIAQCFIEADVPMFCALAGDMNFVSNGVDETFWGSSSVSRRDIIKKVVENGGEVMAHHGLQMTQAMLEDFDTCYEHFVEVKKYIEDEGYECNGIITAGGVGQVLGSPLSDMWVRSNFLYADLYGEEEYAEPYYHRRVALLHYKGKLETLKTEITTAMNEKKWCVYYLHNFSELTKGELKELLTWVKEQGYATKTYKEVYDELIAYDIVGIDGSSSTPDMSNYYTKAEINALLSGGTLPKTLSSINATKTTTTYNVGDTIDVSDITVTATYTDGTSNTVTGFTTNVSSLSTATSGSKTLTVSYTEGGITKTKDITLIVSETDDTWDYVETYELTSGRDKLETGQDVTLEGGMQYTISFDYSITASNLSTVPVNVTLYSWAMGIDSSITGLYNNETQTGTFSKTFTANKSGTYKAICFDDRGGATTGSVLCKFKNIAITEVTE